MSIWSRIAKIIAALARGESLSALFKKIRTPPERSVAFTIAVIALGAKMAKADGLVTRSEVTAFKEVFAIAPEDEKSAARLFNLARQDVAGFTIYASQIARIFGTGNPALYDVIEGLFHIAVADGSYNNDKDRFLAEVARIFGLTKQSFYGLRARLAPSSESDPYQILGVVHDMALEEIRKQWRKLVRDTHPDHAFARGLPEEAIRLAEKRLIAFNRAWEEIAKHHEEKHLLGQNKVKEQ